MILLEPEWHIHGKTGPGWHCGERSFSSTFRTSRRGKWGNVSTGWLATADGLKGPLGHGLQNGRAGSVTSGHLCPGVCASRTLIQYAGSCGSLRVGTMSHWTEPRLSSESQHSSSWPLSSLVPVSLKSQDLGALTQVLVPTYLVFQNLRWISNSLLAPNDMPQTLWIHRKLPACLLPWVLPENSCTLAKAPKPPDKLLRRRSTCVGWVEA